VKNRFRPGGRRQLMRRYAPDGIGNRNAGPPRRRNFPAHHANFDTLPAMFDFQSPAFHHGLPLREQCIDYKGRWLGARVGGCEHQTSQYRATPKRGLARARINLIECFQGLVIGANMLLTQRVAGPCRRAIGCFVDCSVGCLGRAA